jgi:hypothetical protein
MTPRRPSVPGMHESRTQGAGIAALLPRRRTQYGAARCARVAGASFFSSLLSRPNASLEVCDEYPRLQTGRHLCRLSAFEEEFDRFAEVVGRLLYG